MTFLILPLIIYLTKSLQLTYIHDKELQNEYPTFITSPIKISDNEFISNSNEYKFPMPKISILDYDHYIVTWTVPYDYKNNNKFIENDVYGRILNINGNKINNSEFIINKFTNYSQDTIDVTVLYDNNNNILPIFAVTWESFEPEYSDDIYLNLFEWNIINDTLLLNILYQNEFLVNIHRESIQGNPQIVSLFDCNCFLILWISWDSSNTHSQFYDVMGRTFYNNGYPIDSDEFLVHEPTTKLEHNQRVTPLKLSINTNNHGFWLTTYTVYDGTVSGVSGIYASILDEKGRRYISEQVIDGGIDVYKLNPDKVDVNGKYYHEYSDCTYLISDYVMIIYITKKENSQWLKQPKIIGNIYKINFENSTIDTIKPLSKYFNPINLDKNEPFYPRVKVLRCYYYEFNNDNIDNINDTLYDNTCDISICWYSEGDKIDNKYDYNVFCEFYNIKFIDVNNNDIQVNRINSTFNDDYKHLMINNKIQNARYPDIDTWDRINSSKNNNNSTNSGNMIITWLMGDGYGIFTRLLHFNTIIPTSNNITIPITNILSITKEKHNTTMIISLVSSFLIILICLIILYYYKKIKNNKKLFKNIKNSESKSISNKKKKRFTFKNNKISKHEQIDLNDTDYDTDNNNIINDVENKNKNNNIDGNNIINNIVINKEPNINEIKQELSKSYTNTKSRRASVAVTTSHDSKGRNIYQLKPDDTIADNTLSTDDDDDDDEDDPLDNGKNDFSPSNCSGLSNLSNE